MVKVLYIIVYFFNELVLNFMVVGKVFIEIY